MPPPGGKCICPKARKLTSPTFHEMVTRKTKGSFEVSKFPLQWPYSRQMVQWTASGVLQFHFPVWALYVQVGDRAADKIVFSMAELTLFSAAGSAADCQLQNMWFLTRTKPRKKLIVL